MLISIITVNRSQAQTNNNKDVKIYESCTAGDNMIYRQNTVENAVIIDNTNHKKWTRRIKCNPASIYIRRI